MTYSNPKTVNVLTKPGMNLIAPVACRECIHLTERKFCRIWAFPESKWKKNSICQDYSVTSGEMVPDTNH